MAKYAVEYAFELLEPVDGKHGGYAQLTFETDDEIVTEEDWNTVARECFKVGEGKYRSVQIQKMWSYDENDVSDKNVLSEGDVI